MATESTPWGASKKTGEHSDWVAVQRKTFTRWMNSYLKRNGEEVEDLVASMNDGLKLASLLEIISGDSMGRLNKKCRMDLQKMENLNAALAFLKDHDIQLVNIGSRDLMEGNEKLILGLMWTVILRFEVNDADGKAGLLLWCQRSTKGYAGVDVKNFTSSWNDGLAFCAIINRYRPDLLEFEGLSKANALENLELAFQVAEEKLGISRFLDPEDVANVPRPDEKSIIAYVSQFFKLFAGAAKNDALIKSIERAVAVTREHDRLMDEFTVGGTALASDVAGRTATLRESNADDTTSKVKDTHTAFTTYLSEDRPKLLVRRAELEGTYQLLRASKRNNQRPDFVPPAEISPEGMATAFSTLEEAEQAHERQLIDKFARFQKVDLSVTRFNNKAATVEEWLNERAANFATGDVGNSVSECRSKLEAHKRYENRLLQYQELVNALHSFADVVASEGGGEHADEGAVAERMASIDSLLADVIERGVAYKALLEEALAHEISLQEKLVAFEANLEELDFDLDNTEEQLVEPIEGATVDALNRMANDELAAIRAKLLEIGTMLDDTRGLAADVAPKRPDAATQVEALVARKSKADEELAQREQLLGSMLANESKKDELRKNFAEAAEWLDDFTTTQEKALGASTGHGAEDLEGQMKAVAAVEAACGPDSEAASVRMPALESLSKECEAEQIVDNPYTRLTVHAITAMWLQLLKNIKDVKAALASQILAKQSAAVSPELLNELHEVFAACDQDKDSLLNLTELRNACQGGGIDMEDAEVEATLKLRSPERMALDLDQFVEFALEQIKSGDSEDDVLQAFKTLSGGKVISDEQISMHFAEPELQGYLKENIAEGNYTAFTQQLFTR